jgi:hydroxymethylbilane synthase
VNAMRPLRLGTRGSALALAQSGTVADALRALGAEVEIVRIRTEGDQRPPDTAWGEGAFVGALEQALLDGTVDLAVHSAKDVPTTEDPRLTIAAFPVREDPRDALVIGGAGGSLESLPDGARVGTADRPSCWPDDRTCGSIRSTATSTRGSAGSGRARPTPWSWPWPDSPGWA